MGSSSSNSKNGSQSDDPWWSIENEDYVLEQPNLSEINVLIQDNSDNCRRRVKIISSEPFVRDQSTSQSHAVAEKEQKKVRTSQEPLDEFIEELRGKRLARLHAISNLRNEIISLRQQLTHEREVVRRLRNGEDFRTETKDASTCTNDVFVAQTEQSVLQTNGDSQASLRSQLADAQLALQLANADNLSLTTELGVIRKQVITLKEVITCSKQMIEVREEQVNQLKAKIRQIEDSLADRELKIMSDSLRQEYDRQLANIRNLRQLYDERARVCAAERENLLRQISIKKDELASETERTKSLEERISSLENELETSNSRINSLQCECNEFKFENKSLKDEMGVINKLFSQTLMGFNGSNNLDIDSLTTMLEDNRSLLNEIATKEDSSEGASLPKLLFDIVKQANSEEIESSTSQDATTSNQPEVGKVATAQEIIGNLPKVWRVLMELLNHHKIEKVQFKENGQSEDCYKSVQAPTGPKAELSVSKTYIKLKDLILEKKSLQKETNKLKTLNSHLERRLNEQEKRLSTVSLELTKTWHIVGKMQRQHRQLHTNEQILRYQLSQKRRLLNELKDELEYCRRKWAAARAKNAESQLQCDDLRKEFARRKIEDANNSAESGYSDGPLSSDEDDQPVTKRNFEELFENPKKIERMQSASPTRMPFVGLTARGKSAPPTTTFLAEFTQIVDEISTAVPLQNVAATSIVSEKPVAAIAQTPSRVAGSSRGAVPKPEIRLSRSRKRETPIEKDEESLEEMFLRISGLPGESSTPEAKTEEDTKRSGRAERIYRLEKQCKSLIAQVIETAENREKLEIQLCKFQDEVPPAQKPIPFDEYLSGNVAELKEDPFPETSDLLNKATNTANKRDERLKLLEEESKQLISKIKRTADRSKNMKTRLEKIRSRCSVSREGSTDSSIASGDEASNVSNRKTLTEHKPEEDNQEGASVTHVCSTSGDDDHTKYMAKRLKSLVDENKARLSEMSRNSDPKKDSDKNTEIGKCTEAGNELHVSSGSEVAVTLTAEEVANVTRRDERLKRLEEEGKKLINKLSNTNERGSDLSNRLDEIHEQAVSKSGETSTCDPSELNSQSHNPSPAEDSKSAIGKLEEVKKRLEESKKLLSQLSSDPDMNADVTSRRRSGSGYRSNRQSESEPSSDNLPDTLLTVQTENNLALESDNDTVEETSVTHQREENPSSD